MFSSWGQTPPSVNTNQEAAENGTALNEAPKENIPQEKAYEDMPDRGRMPTKEVPSENRLELQKEPIQENKLRGCEAWKVIPMERGEWLKRPKFPKTGRMPLKRMPQEKVPKRENAKVETPRDHPSTFSLSRNQVREANQVGENSAENTEKEGNIKSLKRVNLLSRQ